MSELKNCPFCGSHAFLFIPDDIRMQKNGCFVECNNCGCRTAGDYPNADSKRVAIEAWNARADGWISASVQPKETGRYTVNSSYGVRDAFFTAGFVKGDFSWQDCQTGDDEGMCNMDGVDFEVYDWMPLPTCPSTNK